LREKKYIIDLNYKGSSYKSLIKFMIFVYFLNDMNYIIKYL